MGTPATAPTADATTRLPRGFLALVAGYSCSAFGNYLNLIALSLYTLALTGSPLGVGVVMALRLGTGFVTGLVAGALVTRLDRRTVMVGTDLAQALAMVALALGPRHVVVLAGAAAVLGAGNTLFTVALRSSVPELVGQDQRVRANGLLVSGRAAGTVAGFASAGLIVGAGGFATAFLVNAGSFLVSAAVLVRLRPQAWAPPRPAARRPRLAAVRVLGPVVAAMVVVRGCDALGSASHNMAMPVYANELAPANPAVLMSQFWAAWAVGSLLAHRVTARASRRLGERAFAWGTCLMSVCFVLAFVVPAGPLLMATALLAGVADGFTEIVYTSRLQAVPDDLRGRLFGLSATAETCGFAVGMVTSSALLDGLPSVAVVGAFHGLPVVAAIGLLAVLSVSRRAGEKPCR